MPWQTGDVSPSWMGSHAEFWFDGELVLFVSTIDVMPAEGMYVTYINLAEEEVTHRVGEVTIVLREEREVPEGADPSPGRQPLYVRPTVKVELQP